MMIKTAKLVSFSTDLGGTISLPSKAIFWGLNIVGIPHLGTRIRLYLLSQALKKINIKKGAAVLDAGSGYGFISLHLACRNFKVTGVDNDLTRIQMAKNLSTILNIKGVDFKKANLYQLPFPDKTFDLSLCLEVLEHLNNDIKALKELVRITKDQGHLIVSFPQYDADLKDFKKLGHLRSGYTIDQFTDMTKKTGLTIRGIYPYGNSALGKIVREINFQILQKSVILGCIVFPILYLLLRIDQHFPSENPSNFLVVLCKNSS